MVERITDVVLNETDRKLVQLAARILTALDPGPTRIEAIEATIQAYADDLGEAHAGAAPDTLEDLALGFGGALMIEMERVMEDRAKPFRPHSEGMGIVSPADRRRLIEAIGRYLEMVKPATH
jgi:hypothetical protein